MRKYTIFHAPAMAFFSREFYRDVGMHWQGISFLYLLLLLAICWLPFFFTIQGSVSTYIATKAPAFVSQIPLIRITNGEAFVEVAQPIKITDPESGKVEFLIDTTGAITSLEGSEAHGLLTKTSLAVRKDQNEIRTISLKTIGDFVITQQRVSSWLNIVRNFTGIVFYLSVVLGSFIFRIVQGLVYTVIGLLFAKLCRTRISFQALLSLSLLSITPVVIFATLTDLAGLNIPFSGWIYLVAAMIYLFLGVKAMAVQEEPQQTEDNESVPPLIT
jgi:hypothetical protein